MPRRRLRGADPTTPESGWAPPLQGIMPMSSVPSLHRWLGDLPGLPRPVDRVVTVTCPHHEDEPAPLSRVEADPVAGVALRRCEACDDAVPLLDSAARWTAPPLWACPACGGQAAELAAGLSLPDGEHVDWVVLAAECGACHAPAGLTDIVVPPTPVADVLAAL